MYINDLEEYECQNGMDTSWIPMDTDHFYPCNCHKTLASPSGTTIADVVSFYGTQALNFITPRASGCTGWGNDTVHQNMSFIIVWLLVYCMKFLKGLFFILTYPIASNLFYDNAFPVWSTLWSLQYWYKAIRLKEFDILVRYNLQ